MWKCWFLFIIIIKDCIWFNLFDYFSTFSLDTTSTFKIAMSIPIHVDPSYFSLQSWIVLVRTWQVSNLVPFWYSCFFVLNWSNYAMSLSLLWSLLPCYNCDLHLENCHNVNEPIGIPIKSCLIQLLLVLFVTTTIVV